MNSYGKGVFVLKKYKRERESSFLNGRKKIIAAVLLLGVGLCIAAVFVPGVLWGDDPVKFEVVKESEMPNDITSDIIPEYKTLERALACVLDDDVYVIVARGEKPTSGFNVSVDRMSLEEKNGKKNLIVYALFEDPQKETAISQIITYPIQVVKTDLDALPDSIELRIQY